MNILIFEDEVYNFHLLRNMLQELNPDYNVIGPISTVEEGRAYLSYHQDTDLIIADIQLNDGLSFDALSFAPDDVPIIFTTAYGEHSLKAFEYNSLSYLLKPIDESQLQAAMKKASRLITPNRQRLFDTLRKGDSHRHRFIVNTARGSRCIPETMVRYAVSEEKTTYIYLLDDTSYPISLSISELAGQLDPRLFMRVNRKYIVPIEQVKGTERMENGKMRLLLYGTSSPEITVSRIRRKSVWQWLQQVKTK